MWGSIQQLRGSWDLKICWRCGHKNCGHPMLHVTKQRVRWGRIRIHCGQNTTGQHNVNDYQKSKKEHRWAMGTVGDECIHCMYTHTFLWCHPLKTFLCHYLLCTWSFSVQTVNILRRSFCITKRTGLNDDTHTCTDAHWHTCTDTHRCTQEHTQTDIQTLWL